MAPHRNNTHVWGSFYWKSGISGVTKKCKCVTNKEIWLCRYVTVFFCIICAGRIIIPVKLFQRCKIHCSQCKHFKIYVVHGHDSNMARHLYHQLCFLWPFQDSSVATSPGRFVWESFASLWVSLPPDGDMGLSPEDAPRAGKLEINLTYIHPQRHLRELWET